MTKQSIKNFTLNFGHGGLAVVMCEDNPYNQIDNKHQGGIMTARYQSFGQESEAKLSHKP